MEQGLSSEDSSRQLRLQLCSPPHSQCYHPALCVPPVCLLHPGRGMWEGLDSFETKWTGLTQKQTGWSISTVPQSGGYRKPCWDVNFKMSIAVFKSLNAHHRLFHSCALLSYYLELRNFGFILVHLDWSFSWCFCRGGSEWFKMPCFHLLSHSSKGFWGAELVFLVGGMACLR